MNGVPLGPGLDDERDAISLWLLDSLAQAESVLAAAGSMGWSESQIQELRQEATTSCNLSASMAVQVSDGSRDEIGAPAIRVSSQAIDNICRSRNLR